MCEILIADFGSQYTFRIAKTIRKMGYYCEIVDPRDIVYKELVIKKIKLLILSGGPQSVYETTSDGKSLYLETVNEIGRVIDDSEICVLGICFGLQYMCHYLHGGKVMHGNRGEYGKAYLEIDNQYRNNPLISWMYREKRKYSYSYSQTKPQSESDVGVDDKGESSIPVKKRGSFLKRFGSVIAKNKTIVASDQYVDTSQPIQVWMSHQDLVVSLPPGFDKLGSTDDCKYALISNTAKRLYGMQFHPEVHHTRKGKHYLRALIMDVCDCTRNWNNAQMVEECENYITSMLQANSDANVILGKI